MDLEKRDALKLTEKQKEFCRRVVEGYEPRAAYRLAYNAANMKPETVSRAAHELLRDPNVAKFIEMRRSSREFRSDVTAAMVLEQWWRIASADPRELIRVDRGACRFCYGTGHKYHWIDADEWAMDCAEKIDAEKAPRSNEGGYGFDPRLPPLADCPRCFGKGVVEVYLADTSKISERAAVLYAGVEIKPNGAVKVLMRSQDEALASIARHLGMFNDRLPGAANGNPVPPGVTIGVTAKSAAEASAMYTRFMSMKPN